MRLRTAILASVLLLWAGPAFSQACSMCYSTANATSKDGQRAINRGVVVLLVPTLSFMTLGVWMALRYAKKRDFEQLKVCIARDKDRCVRVIDQAVFAAINPSVTWESLKLE